MKKNIYILFILLFIILSSLTVSAQEETSEYNDGFNSCSTVFEFIDGETLTVCSDNGKIVLCPVKMTVDLNGDNATTSADSRLILRHTAKLEIFDGNIADIDVNSDCMITATDARLVLRYAAKLDCYYRASDGSIVTGMFSTDDNKVFMLDSFGAATTGLKTIDGFCYYFEKGVAVTGAQSVKGTLYYFDEDGKGVNGDFEIDSKPYYFVDGKAFTGYRNKLYYHNGEPANGTFEIDGITYNFENGISHTGYKTVNGKKVYYLNGSVANGFADISGKTYLFTEGVITYGWRYVAGSYYHLDRATGELAKNTTVDGIKVGADGKAVNSSYNNEKIKTFMRARDIMEKITDPSDSVSEKKLKCFRWVMSCSYRQYRLVGASMKKSGWEMLFANDIFINGNGCCGSTSAAFAFLAVECGCKDVYFCDDGVSTDGHAWVTMEGNNRVYDVVFAKSKSFNKNYDAVASDYRRTPPRKSYIGG